MVQSALLVLVLVAFVGSIQAYPLVLQYVPYDELDNNEAELDTDSGPAPWFGRTLIQPEGLYGDDAVAPTEDETIRYMPIKRGKKPQKLQTGYYNYDFDIKDLNIDTGVGYLDDDAYQGEDDDKVHVEDVQFDDNGDWDRNSNLENARSLIPFMPVLARYNSLEELEDTDADFFELDDEYDDNEKDQDDEYDNDDQDDDNDYHHNPYEIGHHDLWSHKSKVGSHLHGSWPYKEGPHPPVVHSSHGYVHPLDKYHTNAMYSQGMQTLYHTLRNKYDHKYLSHPNGGSGHHGGYHYKTIHL